MLDRAALEAAANPKSVSRVLRYTARFMILIEHRCSTPFGLYRDGTELRAVYYSKPEVARAACFSLGDQCDYPILMGKF